MPGATPLLVEDRTERLRDRFEVLRVLDRVVDHGLGKRAAGPIGLLAAFVEGDAAKMLNQRAIAESLEADQLRGQHRIENRLRLRCPRPAKHSQIEIGSPAVFLTGLDVLAGHAGLAREYAAAYADLSLARAELSRVRAELSGRDARQKLVRQQVALLEKLGLRFERMIQLSDHGGENKLFAVSKPVAASRIATK